MEPRGWSRVMNHLAANAAEGKFMKANRMIGVMVSLLLVASVAWAADPVPVTIEANLVKVSAGTGSMSVVVVTDVSSADMNQSVKLTGESYVTIQLADVKQLGQAMAAMVKTMTVGDEKKIGGVQIRIGKFDDGLKYVTMSRIGSYSSGGFMDAAAAKQVADALGKADEVAAWVKQRAAAFQK
jgi:hypothetical protein